MSRLIWKKSSFSGGGNGNCVETAVEWTKSSYSTSGDNECVEVAGSPRGLVRLRESDQPETVLSVAPGIWSAFTRAVKAGEYDHACRL
ncbi:DUF397 domain-containing protein [Streptomyces xinghaiensis]|uniref:DUF397 domain-containing protein n=1 Tax=Streptomyces xinghaiensis TaxID=1038928 RepID=UPI003439B3A3